MSLAARKIRLIMTLRRSGITDTAVLAAIERIPREAFVPPSFLDQAYENRALPIGLGQTLSQPQVVALMTQALAVRPRHKVLEIGTGSGYQAAVLSRLARRVYSIERHRPLLREAERRFTELRLHNITTIAGDGNLGWREQAPFDRIILPAAATASPAGGRNPRYRPPERRPLHGGRRRHGGQRRQPVQRTDPQPDRGQPPGAALCPGAGPAAGHSDAERAYRRRRRQRLAPR